jgi:hypothetical protein
MLSTARKKETGVRQMLDKLSRNDRVESGRQLKFLSACRQ